MGSDRENTRAGVRLTLSAYGEYVSKAWQLPARGAQSHGRYVLHCHELLIQPSFRFIPWPGLCAEAAGATTALGPAVTGSAMDWVSPEPGTFIYLFLFLSVFRRLSHTFIRPKWHYCYYKKTKSRLTLSEM